MDQPDENQKKSDKDQSYRELQKRFQSTSINKDLNTDDLIKNILEKVDTDAKISKFYSAQNRNTQVSKVSTTDKVKEKLSPANQLTPALPVPQCFVVNSDIPSIYHQMWNLVKADHCGEYCDRDKLYRALLLSNLSSAVLAQLWSFVNRTIPGQLTKSELFVMLALIGLLQQSSQDPVNDLYTATAIPTPLFAQLATSQQYSTSNSTEDEFCDFKSATLDHSSQVAQLNQNDESIQNILPNDVVLHEKTNSSYVESSRDLCNSTEQDVISEEPTFECDFSSTLDNQMNPNHVQTECVNNELKPEDDCSLNASHLITDVQPIVEDKYSSLRGLGTESSKEENDEFGDFLSHPHDLVSGYLNSIKTSPVKEFSNGRVSNKRKLLISCKQAMLKTFNTLVVNHGEESVLEALRSKDGTNFALDLYEVFKISSRIQTNIEMLNDPNEAEACRVLLEEIKRKWNYIYNTFKKASIELSDECHASLSEVTVGRCAICSDATSESSALLFTSYRYHNSCANFWLNSVDSSLPSLED